MEMPVHIPKGHPLTSDGMALSVGSEVPTVLTCYGTRMGTKGLSGADTSEISEAPNT